MVSLSTPWRRIGGAYLFLTSALAESEWSNSRPGRFNLEEIFPIVSIEYEAWGVPQPVWTAFGSM